MLDRLRASQRASRRPEERKADQDVGLARRKHYTNVHALADAKSTLMPIFFHQARGARQPTSGPAPSRASFRSGLTNFPQTPLFQRASPLIRQVVDRNDCVPRCEFDAIAVTGS
jgi:hypothetical protein